MTVSAAETEMSGQSLWQDATSKLPDRRQVSKRAMTNMSSPVLRCNSAERKLELVSPTLLQTAKENSRPAGKSQRLRACAML